MTHRGRVGGSWARLDRCYSSIWMAGHLVASVSDYGDRIGPLSDHCPLLMRWACPRPRLHFPQRVPEWVLQSARWHSRLAAALEEALDPTDDEWAQVEVVKALMRRAAREVIREEPYGGIRDVGYQLSVALGIMRCLIAGDEAPLRRLSERSPAMRIALAHPRGPARTTAVASAVGRAFFQHLEARLTQELARAEGAEQEQDRQRGKQKRAHLLRVAAAWRQRKAPARIQAVLDSGGVPHSRPEDQARIFGEHWQRVFSVSVDPLAAASLAPGRVPQIPDSPEYEWTLSYEDFAAMARRAHTTSPGPDGLSYTAWKCAPAAVLRVLYGVYRRWMSKGELPPEFNCWAFLALLPKKDSAALQASETRPLSLANCDAKLLASACSPRASLGSAGRSPSWPRWSRSTPRCIELLVASAREARRSFSISRRPSHPWPTPFCGPFCGSAPSPSTFCWRSRRCTRTTSTGSRGRRRAVASGRDAP